MSSLETIAVTVKLSDPWELGEALKWEPLAGAIVSTEGESALVRLSNPFEFKNTTCEFFVASPRHEGHTISELADGKSLFCGMTRISSEQAKSLSPCDLTNWRGGVAMIATLEPTPTP
jgi:hypothetical protein